jgi:predicted amidohydrolase YtcJ
MKFVFLLIVLVIAACSEKTISADTILFNGVFATLEDSLPEATALAIKGDRILAIGIMADLKKFQNDSTQMIDLNGQFVTPGFIEGHGHLMGLGQSKLQLYLLGKSSFEEIAKDVAEKAKSTPKGEWILGRGWHQDKWSTIPSKTYQGLPYNDILTEAAPNNPVMLYHASGHSLIANKKAFELAGITEKTKSPNGGEIIKDKSGKLLGILSENAMGLIEYSYNSYLGNRTIEKVNADAQLMLDLATKECAENGITSFVDAGALFSELDLYKLNADANTLNTRIYAMILESAEQTKARANDYHWINRGNGFLTVNGVKRSIDGALGSRGAWLLEPYSDVSTTSGLNTVTVEEMKEMAEFCIKNNFQFAAHAIGDKANRFTLDIFEEAFKNNSDKTDLRWRVEHAQHLNLEDIPRFASLKVIPAMQAVHCISDGPWVPVRIGDKRSEDGAYVWKKLMESGSMIANGTDVPVELIDPFNNYFATVTRMMNNGKEFYPSQKLSRLEAIKSYTINNAFAIFKERELGTLKPGKWADLTVFSQNLLSVKDDEIKKTTIAYTFVGGKIRFKK